MRNYKRITERGASLQKLNYASKAVRKRNMSVNAAARQYNVNRMTLTRYLKKLDAQPSLSRLTGYAASRMIFSTEQEDVLQHYLLQMAAIFFELSPINVRQLAYAYAMKIQTKMPDSWPKNQMAGEDWLSGFLKRHPLLSIRKPESTTSLGITTAFNKDNVQVFFDKLATVFDKYKFSASRIGNIDETDGVSTVLKSNKIVAATGKRNAGAMTFGEHGVNVNLIVGNSAVGNSLPPIFVFPRKKYEHYFVNRGPSDCISTVNASGWSTTAEFYQFMEHFINHIRPSVDNPVLLILNNHSSHLYSNTLNFAKDNGIVMLSFPSHCSHKLQSLDEVVFGPFKKYAASTQYSWLRNNPGKSITICDIPKIVSKSLPLGTIVRNIM